MALGDGVVWDETLPSDSTNLTSGDDHQRHIKKGIRLRMANEHEWPDSQTGTAEAGQHKFITLQATATPSNLIATTQRGGISLASSGTGYEFYMCACSTATTAGDDVQISFLGGMNIASGKVAGQAQADLLYAVDATTGGWTPLAIGTTGDLLYSVDGTAPGYISLVDFGTAHTGGSGIVKVGDITAGTWSGDIGDNIVLSAAISSGAVTAAKVSAPLGAWSTVGATSGQASVDIILCVDHTDNDTSRLITEGYTDDGDPASEVKVRADVVNAGGGPLGAPITFPVKSGHYWKVVATATVAVHSIPIGV
jgi:hypothetical protein